MRELLICMCIGVFISGCDNSNGKTIALPKGSKIVETKDFKSQSQCVSYAKDRQSKDDVTKINEGANSDDMYAVYMHLNNGHSLMQVCTHVGGGTRFTLIESDHLIK